MTAKPLVSLVIPIYREAGHLREFLAKIDRLDLGCADLELVFVEDCSDDSSRQILRGFTFTQRHQIIVNDKNLGKGASVSKGIAAANGTIIGIQDSDFEYSFAEIPRLITPIINEEIDVALSCRFHPSNHQTYRNFHYLKNCAITLLSNFCSDLHVSDVSSCYKFFTAKVIKETLTLTSQRFGIDVEIIAQLARLRHLRIKEYPISYHPRSHAQGKKITWRDGIDVAVRTVYYNFFVSR